MQHDAKTLLRHLNETALCLRREGYTVERLPGERLAVTDENGLRYTVEKPGLMDAGMFCTPSVGFERVSHRCGPPFRKL